jgi:hypothetical protein
MLKGNIQLSLLIGPMVPIPVPKPVIEALTKVTVKTEAGLTSGFQLTFSFDSKSPLNVLLLLLGQIGPFIRTIILVNINGIQHVLMDGMVENHQITPDVQTGKSTFTISGSDLTTLMRQIDFTGTPYPGMTAEARVAAIIAKYAGFGLIPKIIPSAFIDVPIPTKRIPIHKGTDLDYIQELAGNVGHVFYVEPGPAPGSSVAYWGPEIKVGTPQAALNINMDSHTNVESLDFSFNGDSKAMPIIYIQNQLTGAPMPIPIPDITPLNPPLGLIPPFPSKFPRLTETTYMSTIQAIAHGAAEAARTSNAVEGSGSLNVVRYGHILKARSLVGVRGAGEAFNGLYYVKSVTHNIEKGKYTQNFSLSRNGLVSTLPKLPV